MLFPLISIIVFFHSNNLRPKIRSTELKFATLFVRETVQVGIAFS